MRNLVTLALLLVVATGCSKSKKLDPAQLEARQAVKNLGAIIQGQQAVTVRFTKKNIQDSDIAALTILENVTYLDLTGTAIGDQAMTYMPRINGLQVLILADTNVTDAGMSDVEKVTGLVQLTCNEQIGDDGIASLSNAGMLNYLNLKNTQVTDKGLEHLVNMKNLKRLNLDGTQVTDKGLEHLAALSGLHTLQLNATKITDNGVPLLENLTNLSALAIAGTGVTPVAVAKLQDALPDTSIDSGEALGAPMEMGGGGPGGGGGRPSGGGGGGGGGRSFDPGALVERVMESNDEDQDGILSAEEIEGISEQFRSRLTAADADQDGAISSEELLKYFTDRAAQRGSSGSGSGRPGGEEASPDEPAEEDQGGVFGSLLRAVSNGAQKTLATPAEDAGAGDE